MPLNQPLYVRSGVRAPRRPLLTRVGYVVFVATLILVNYFVFFRDDRLQPPQPPVPAIQTDGTGSGQTQPTAPERSPSADELRDGDTDGDTPVADEKRIFAGDLKSGDRMFDVLLRLGLDATEARRVVRATETVFDFRTARVGDQFRLEVNLAGRVDRFEFRRSPVEIYDVVRDEEAYKASKRDVKTTVERVAIGCVIRQDLRRSLERCAGDPELARKLSHVLSWVVDPATEVRERDEVRAIVEKVLADGTFLKHGRVLAAEYRGKFVNDRLFSLEGPDGQAGYYRTDGGSIESRFLRSPLSHGARGSYADGALAPVLHRYRRHVGLDYPVRKGTPVVAIADGTIGFAGPKGRSGTLLAVRHGGKAVSYYAHLSRIERGVKKGVKVQQGDVIGYSGDSGAATEPRLHFAMKINGKFVNLLEHRSEPQRRLSEEALAKVKDRIAELTALLDAVDVLDGAGADS